MILGIYKELHPYVHEAKCNELVGTLNGTDQSLVSLQNINYNQYYDWHCDGWDKAYEKKGS
jgi:hypothetical protein